MVLSQAGWDPSGSFQNGENISTSGSDQDLPWAEMLGIIGNFTGANPPADGTLRLVGVDGIEFNLPFHPHTPYFGRWTRLKATPASTANIELLIMKG